MNSQDLTYITSYLWGINNDLLIPNHLERTYPNPVLAMVIIRRLDTVLESTKQDVLRTKSDLDTSEVVDHEAALCKAAGRAFYNISPYLLADIKVRDNIQQLEADFKTYIDGFSPNVQEILEKLNVRERIPTLIKAGILGPLLDRILDHSINLSPLPVHNTDGTVRLAGLDNEALKSIFTELIRRSGVVSQRGSNSNSTPDVTKLMMELLFRPNAEDIRDGTYTIFSADCARGAMLDIAESRLTELASERGKRISIQCYGQESMPEDYAILMAELLIRNETDIPRIFDFGSTLFEDRFAEYEFDFICSNPALLQTWRKDSARLSEIEDLKGSRFTVTHNGEELSLLTRSRDGQLMYLANRLGKMNSTSPHGTRIAEVHGDSSLLAGDAGEGACNIRRWIIENDWLEAVVRIPYNSSQHLSSWNYILVLSNRKTEGRKGTVQLIDTTGSFEPSRKTISDSDCVINAQDSQRVVETYQSLQECEYSKILANADFGFWKVVVERPLRLKNVAQNKAYSPDEISLLLTQGERDESAQPIIRKTYAVGEITSDPLHGLFEAIVDGKTCVVEYEPDIDLRDTEHIPLLENGGMEAYMRREVFPFAGDAWIDPAKTLIGYEIRFMRHFYKSEHLRSLEEIRRDIEALDRDGEGLHNQLLANSEVFHEQRA